MKKILVILCSPLFLFSQEIKHKITWESNFILESNSLDRSFLNSMLYGGYITDNMKSKWIDSGDKNNIIYAEIRNGLSYNYNFKKQSIGFSLADINSLNASFTDDLLSIGFKGNFYNQDKTLDFAGTSLRSDRFQQYKIKYVNSQQFSTAKSQIKAIENTITKKNKVDSDKVWSKASEWYKKNWASIIKKNI